MHSPTSLYSFNSVFLIPFLKSFIVPIKAEFYTCAVAICIAWALETKALGQGDFRSISWDFDLQVAFRIPKPWIHGLASETVFQNALWPRRNFWDILFHWPTSFCRCSRPLFMLGLSCHRLTPWGILSLLNSSVWHGSVKSLWTNNPCFLGTKGARFAFDVLSLKKDKT